MKIVNDYHKMDFKEAVFIVYEQLSNRPKLLSQFVRRLVTSDPTIPYSYYIPQDWYEQAKQDLPY